MQTHYVSRYKIYQILKAKKYRAIQRLIARVPQEYETTCATLASSKDKVDALTEVLTIKQKNRRFKRLFRDVFNDAGD